ncbi:MBL fold metallo-hydrolase [Chitinophaga oryzae]|uniref:MBL fold metallo-hydrolase n=1 Tax=Chitinophaga oryzae TaxID=2725414 RepID=A0AAE6ZFV6_9BACT|nr:MBL fold metallo-hydrolase [Chitinophaga oryzae]QJB32213.1 MBL fold metallo-hydrolase [Chitinophaga oryzae]
MAAIFDTFFRNIQRRRDRKQRISMSENYQHRQFQNLVPTRTYLKGTSFLSLFRSYLRISHERDPLLPLPGVREDLKAQASRAPEIIWFGHSSYLLYINRWRILVDPVFSNTLSLTPFIKVKGYAGTSIYTVDDLPPIDFVIITHDHQDHLDFKSVRELAKRGCLFCVPLGVGTYLERLQVPATRIMEFDWWDQLPVDNTVVLTATPARHNSGRGLFTNKTLWSSYVLNIDGLRIFIGGDSGYGEHFKAIAARCGIIDLAILECGQYGDHWPDIHMTPEQTISAGKDLDARVLMPVHWGRFPLALHNWLEPVVRVEAAAAKASCRLLLPQIGKRTFIFHDQAENKWWEQMDYSKQPL